jgi:sodium transport system permease protein
VNRVLLKYELMGLLRDTRTIFLSVLLPIILLPVLLFALDKFGQRATGELDQTYDFGRVFPAPGLELVTSSTFDPTEFRERLVEDGEEMLKDGHIDLLIRVGSEDKVDAQLGSDIKSSFPGFGEMIDAEAPGRPVVELLYRSDRERSVRAYLKATDLLLEFRQASVDKFLQKSGGEVGVVLTSEDISTPQERAARQYGPALSAFIILMLLGGGSVAALDSLAGERERGTLSTLFVSSIDRKTIAWTKFCAVAIISVAIAMVQILNMACYVAFGYIDWPMQSGQSFEAFGALLLLFAVEAIFTAALLLHISARSSSFKEAQLFFFPAFLIAFGLSLAGLMPALEGASVVSLIPLTGPGVFIPEILAGRIDLLVLLTQCAVHLFAAYLFMASTIGRMDREDFLGGQGPQHGKALIFEQFSQRALPFFAFLCAALFVVPSNFAALSSLKGQGLFNQLVLFVLAPYLLLKFYRQDVRRVVPIKRVDLRIVLACLALIPLGQLAATGLSQVLGPLLPAPVKALEMMMELLDLENTPRWQLFVLIGLLPGICEEFAFRGVLLHALHKRFNPWALAFVVALVFGFFHVNFFRVLPTAYLGFFMALLTLATGSVLPAMLVHIGNNSLAVWAMFHHMDFEGLPPYVYVVGLIGQLVLTGLIIKWGRGYPGTSWARSNNNS